MSGYGNSETPVQVLIKSSYIDDAKTADTADTVSLTAKGAEANIGFAIVPKGIGAITAQIPDGTTAGGNARGTNAVDFQFYRASADQVAGGYGSFIAGGRNNKIADIVNRDTHANYCHVEGYGNGAYEQYAHVEGNSCIADGKVSHAESNCNICSANDSHVEGNRTVAGRKYFHNITTGSEDAGDDLGVLQYVIIPDAEGDVSSYFPNALFADITTRYGTGAQADTKGNVYASGHTPAVWTGDTPTTLNDLKWALHTVCILRGTAHEYDMAFANIAKAVYASGSGTKVYYYGDMPFASLLGIYSSYASNVSIGGVQGGNGHHAEGLFTSTFGYGTHSEGSYTRAWNSYAHAEGNTTTATGECSHAEGYLAVASGKYAHAEGDVVTASGDSSHAEGHATTASGKYAHAEGNYATASGEGSHAEGQHSTASGRYSRAAGTYAIASREHQQSFSIAKNTVNGDNQVFEIQYKNSVTNAGWHVIKLLDNCETGRAYNFETMVLGRQTAGAGGAVGDTFAYKFTGCVVFDDAGACTVLGTPTRTLIGRSSGMSGDGLTTGVRVAWYGLYPTSDDVVLRMDSIADTTFVVNTYSRIQEMGL